MINLTNIVKVNQTFKDQNLNLFTGVYMLFDKCAHKKKYKNL